MNGITPLAFPLHANSLSPSAEESTDAHITGGVLLLLVTHVSPPLVDVHVFPGKFPGAAINFRPFADDAVVQAPFGAGVDTQLFPEFVLM